MRKHKDNSIANFKRGTTEMVILRLLSEKDLYGYEITQAIKEKSNGKYLLLAGTLYNILFRLNELGYISNYIKQIGTKRKRRYYHIEDEGKRYLSKVVNEYSMICESVNRILKKK